MMDEYKDSNHSESENEWAARQSGSSPVLVAALIVLVVLCVVAFTYGYHQKSMVSQASAQAATANASLTQMQSQVDALTAKLNTVAVTAAQTPAPSTQPAATPESPSSSEPSVDVASQTPEASTAPAAPIKKAHPKHRVAKRHAPVDKKYEQLQAQLADQQKQLKDTQDEVAKDRSDLESSINSTRDDLNSTRDNLNGSIAKTHDELVVLEKRGERSYFEFDLNKSKQFARVGPLTLSLRKADTKHKSFDLAMIVDDNELQKKKVNLFEPIWIHDENENQPVQIVVNKIDKDHVHGYISAPKYKPSDLATTTTGSASMTPVSAKAPATAASNAPNVPDQQPPQQQQQQ
ncbi:MAG: hypothetical protein WBG02_03070 [Candidatus Acidiferrum sp.]